MERRFLLLIFIASFYENGNTSVLDWVWRTKADDVTVSVADGVPLISIPYESMTEDEKFLQEAAKFTEIQVSSPLETCQHKVVMQIRTSCTDMTEEQLAKLSVNLLNCQSAVEGRKMFPCTEEMSLKQCTTDMDADMWNAYHLMSNRARAVCYAARSTQFRALTELTVNKLMKSAHSQIAVLDSLKESQDRLEEQTTQALSSLSAGNKALLEQQQHLKDAQITAHQLVTINLKELNNEKALIRSGHSQLAAMAEDIKSKLEKAHKDLEQQAIERGENHQEILQDLINIQVQTQSIWQKIESSTDNILEQHEKSIAQYEQTLQKLTQINNTVQYIWNITDTMRAEVDEKLGWITNYIGDTGEQIQKVYRTILHVVYILVAMIVAVFLQVPFLTRAAIMGIVPINLVTYLKHGMEASLDFMSITVLIFLITAMHFVMIGIQRLFGTSDLRERPVNLIDQNRYFNGNVNDHTSALYSNSAPKAWLHTKLMRKLQEFYNLTILQIHNYTEKTRALIRLGWSRHNSIVCEELSCSYEPSNKKRDVVHECEQVLPSTNGIDYSNVRYTSHVNNSGDNYYMNSDSEDINNITDAYELKHRLHRRLDTSQTRSVTPSFGLSNTCMATTRTGKRCRKYSSPGRNFCYHHVSGSSVMNDHLN